MGIVAEIPEGIVKIKKKVPVTVHEKIEIKNNLTTIPGQREAPFSPVRKHVLIFLRGGRQ